jgi:carbonic anhydrase
MSSRPDRAVSALEALEGLREGNGRFASGKPDTRRFSPRLKRKESPDAQRPKAIILGCSDSRVPAEIVFDQGIGDLFVIRVAGNIVAPSQVGSVEFAAEQFGTRLVVVLGHTGCGAVEATLQALKDPDTRHSRNMRSIVERIKPALDALDAARPDMGAAVRANIRYSVRMLRHGSQIIDGFVKDDGLLIVGAEYSLETGTVEFLEAVIETDRGSVPVLR